MAPFYREVAKRQMLLQCRHCEGNKKSRGGGMLDQANFGRKSSVTPDRGNAVLRSRAGRNYRQLPGWEGLREDPPPAEIIDCADNSTVTTPRQECGAIIAGGGIGITSRFSHLAAHVTTARSLANFSFVLLCEPSYAPWNGFKTSTRNVAKSRIFRVTTTSPRTRAVAAIIASSSR
jgi:hypothetical protein